MGLSEMIKWNKNQIGYREVAQLFSTDLADLEIGRLPDGNYNLIIVKNCRDFTIEEISKESLADIGKFLIGISERYVVEEKTRNDLNKKKILLAVSALRMVKDMINHSVSKFSWKDSFLDARAIVLLNEVPLKVDETLALLEDET
jgi:hypothetical protein